MITVLILGGVKYIGASLVRYLSLNTDYKIYVACRTKPSLPANVTWIYCDRYSFKDLQELSSQYSFDIVIDNLCYDDIQAQLVIDAFTDKIGHYVVLSSQAVYSAGRNARETDFQTAKHSLSSLNQELIDYPHHQYSIGKRKVELILSLQNKMPTTAIRFPMVLDVCDLRLINIISRTIATKSLDGYSLNNDFSLITRDEAARFIFFLLSNLKPEPINACSNGHFNQQMFLHYLSELGYEITFKKNELTKNIHPYDVHTLWESQSQMSCLSVSDHWTMDNSLATSLGFNFDRIENTLPKFVHSIVNQDKVQHH